MSDAMQIGIEFIPEARGQGLGVDAQRLIADYLFAATPRHPRRGIDRQQQCRRAARAREGRLCARGRDARRSVPRRRVPRPRLLLEAALRSLTGGQHQERVQIDVRPRRRRSVDQLDRARWHDGGSRLVERRPNKQHRPRQRLVARQAHGGGRQRRRAGLAAVPPALGGGANPDDLDGRVRQGRRLSGPVLALLSTNLPPMAVAAIHHRPLPRWDDGRGTLVQALIR